MTLSFINYNHLCRRSLAIAVCIGFAYGQIPDQQIMLAVTGDLASPLTLRLDDLATMPRQTVVLEDQGKSRVVYEGVLLREILQRAGAPLGKTLRGKALASYILAKAHDGYQVLFTLAEVDPQFADETIIVADKRDGHALIENEGPLRLVIGNDKVGARIGQRPPNP